MKQTTAVPPATTETPPPILLVLVTCPNQYRLEIADELDLWVSRHATNRAQIILNGITHRKNGFILLRWTGAVPRVFLDVLHFNEDIQEILIYPAARIHVLLKRGTLTGEGARRLGIPALADHQVEYEPLTRADGQEHAAKVYHQGTHIGENMTLGPDGIMPLVSMTAENPTEEEEPPHDA